MENIDFRSFRQILFIRVWSSLYVVEHYKLYSKNVSKIHKQNLLNTADVLAILLKLSRYLAEGLEHYRSKDETLVRSLT